MWQTVISRKLYFFLPSLLIFTMVANNCDDYSRARKEPGKNHANPVLCSSALKTHVLTPCIPSGLIYRC